MEDKEVILSNYTKLAEYSQKLNELAVKRQNLLMNVSVDQNNLDRIELDMSNIREQVREIYSNMNVEENESLKNVSEEKEDQFESLKDTLDPLIEEAFEQNNTSYFYTIISKDLARAEIPELLDRYPDHLFYALLLVDDGEYEQSVTVIKNKKGEMSYYPDLDNCKSDKERQKIMDEWFKGMPDVYYFARYNDIFN